MSNKTNYIQARQNAELFLKRERTIAENTPNILLDNIPESIDVCTGIFWWDDDTPIHEFSMKSGDKNMGYVLASGNKNFPAIFEYSITASPFSAQVYKYLSALLAESGIFPKSLTLYYISPIEIVAKIESQQNQNCIFVRLPSLEVTLLPPDFKIQRNAANIWSQQMVDDEWNALQQLSSDATGSTKKILTKRQPVKYQQNCDKYSADECMISLDSSSGHYCAPNCIAGCTPVAWAMLSSAWKRSGYKDADKKIWPDSNCWNIDWPSTTNPSKCQVVSDTIWDYHTLMGTTCNGNTTRSNYLKSGPYFKSEWGLSWNWGKKENIDFAYSQKITDASQPYIFGGTGQWDALLESYDAKNQSNVNSGDQPVVNIKSSDGKVGHSVVCYGYDSTNKQIYICLGWGKSFDDKFINISAYPSNIAIFLTETEVDQSLAPINTLT